jgi:hypothetical protein
LNMRQECIQIRVRMQVTIFLVMKIRVSESSHRILRTLAEMKGVSMQTALEQVLEEQQRNIFLTQANEAFAALKSDSKAWREERREREFWAKTVADGMGE